MAYIKFPKSKRKRNPSGMCICCKGKIVNKQRSALYCRNCDRDIVYFRQRLFYSISDIKKKYPDYNIKNKFTITKKNRD